MDDWEARLADLERRLRSWNREVETHLSRVRKERRLGGLFRKPSRPELDAAAVEARRRAGVEVLADAAALFDALCDRYMTSLPQERAKIRARIGGHEAVWDLFWTYVETGPERVRKPTDAAELERALAAMSIEDLRHDIELVEVVLGQLLVAAASAGLDWRGALRKVALVSNNSTGGGAAQMREYLEGFQRSKYHERELAAQIQAAERRALETADATRDRERGGAVERSL